VEERRSHKVTHLQQRKDKTGSTNPLGRTKGTKSPAASSPGWMASAQILSPNAGASRPSRQHHVEHPLSLGMLEMNLQGHGVLWRLKSRNLEGKGAQRARRRKGTASGREARHGCYSRDEPLFKGRLPRSRLETSREVSPDAHRGIHHMTRRPGPTSHTAGALVLECEEGEPPHKEHATATR
jgi:hypothetical protein